jgi:Methylamine utilisation protein MauE
VSEALAPPFLVAALLVGVAGVLKFRAPSAAAHALRELGIPAGDPLVRAVAAGEVGLSVVCVVHPVAVVATVLAAAYVTFAGVAALLVRRRVACGCFGEADAPTTGFHALASAVLAGVAAASAIVGPRGLAWLAGPPGPKGVALAVGVAGATYAVVLVYTEVPRAWAVWSGE